MNHLEPYTTHEPLTSLPSELMPVHPNATTAVSAPGKVLLTGGYLVLDRHYTGTVFALDARIHAVVQQLQRDRKGSNQPETPPTTDEAVDNQPESVIVRSPQFIDAVWEYGVQRCEQGGGVKVTQRNEG